MSPAKGWPQGHLAHSLWTVVRITDLWTGLIRMVHSFPGDPNAPCSGSHLHREKEQRDRADCTETHSGREKHSFCSVGLDPSGGHKPPN